VHSDHHQAVARLAPGLSASAIAADGIVEALEDASARVLAVQWHPERMPASATTRRLFRHFVRLCRS